MRVIISDVKDFIAKGWFFVIGDLDCITQFAAVFYPDGFEKGDFKIINVIIKCGDEKGQYKSIVPVFIAKRKEELREIVGKDLDRLMAITFEKNEKSECMPRIMAPGWFTRKLALYIITERLRKQCIQQPGIPSTDLIETH